MMHLEAMKSDLKREWFTLQGLMNYLEYQHSIGATEDHDCQLKLQKTVRRLERLERALGLASSAPRRRVEEEQRRGEEKSL